MKTRLDIPPQYLKHFNRISDRLAAVLVTTQLKMNTLSILIEYLTDWQQHW